MERTIATFTSCKYSHHNKNKPQKNNFLPKLTPADADLIQIDCRSSYHLRVDRIELNCVICGSQDPIISSISPFLNWQTDFSWPGVMSGYCRSHNTFHFLWERPPIVIFLIRATECDRWSCFEIKKKPDKEKWIILSLHQFLKIPIVRFELIFRNYS